MTACCLPPTTGRLVLTDYRPPATDRLLLTACYWSPAVSTNIVEVSDQLWAVCLRQFGSRDRRACAPVVRLVEASLASMALGRCDAAVCVTHGWSLTEVCRCLCGLLWLVPSKDIRPVSGAEPHYRVVPSRSGGSGHETSRPMSHLVSDSAASHLELHRICRALRVCLSRVFRCSTVLVYMNLVFRCMCDAVRARHVARSELVTHRSHAVVLK